MDIAKQNRLVGWLLADRTVWLQAMPFLKPENFEDPEAERCIAFMQRFMKEYNTLPTEQILQLELGFDPHEKFGKDKPSDVEKSYILKELEEFYKHSRLKEFMLEGISMMEAGDIDYGRLENQMKDIVKASMQVDLGLDYFSNILDRLEEVDKPTYHISTGFETMDKMMNGGWEPSELHLIGGATGAGKSIFLANFSAKNVLKGLDTLMITLELSELVFGLRYDQLLLDKNRDEIMVDKHKTQRMLQKINEVTGGSLTIKFYPTASLRPMMLEAFLEYFFLHRGKYPDIIYIDYLSLMRPNERMTHANTYMMEKIISEELRGIAGQLGVPIISATQLNRSGMDSAIPDKSAVADSIGKIFTVGSLLNIAQTKAEKAMGLTKLFAAKMRNTQSDWMAKFKINYETLKLTELEMILNVGGEDIAEGNPESVKPQPRKAPGMPTAEELAGIQ